GRRRRARRPRPHVGARPGPPGAAGRGAAARDPPPQRAEGRGVLGGRHGHRRRTHARAASAALRAHRRRRGGHEARRRAEPGGDMTSRAVLAAARALTACAALLLGVAWAQGYYPNEPGMSWTYSSGETQTLSGPREVEGRQLLVLTHYFEGVPISEDYLEYTDQGVFSHGSAAGGQVFQYRPALVVYPPSPLEAGMTWTGTTALPG